MATNILFMGSSDFSINILINLAKEFPIKILATQPDRPAGRGKKIEASRVKILANELNIPVIQPKRIKDEQFFNTLYDYEIDLIIVVAYGKILPKRLLDHPKFGCINVHASLLPRWRGASPIQAAILNGDMHTGVTIMKMDEGIDTGPILSKRAIDLDFNETSEILAIKLSEIGSKLLTDTLPLYLEGKIQPQPQNDQGATYTGLIRKEDGILDFDQPSDQLEKKIRAYNPWPICFVKWENDYLRVYKAEVSLEKKLNQFQRGIINKYPCIGTSTTDLILIEVQPSGKKRIDGKSFLNGARNWEK
jgi:methionyl-tRNA formyltransferase